MVNKRKRDEFNDSDSDEIAPGKQILPVANLPYDFDQEPQDGMQYLFLVRRDARQLPHVTRARNPYEVSETKITSTSVSLSSESTVLPCEEWRDAFQIHFLNLRKNLVQTTTHGDKDHICSRRRLIPEKKDRDAWWKYLAGHPESAWSSRDRSERKKPPIWVVGASAKVALPGNAHVVHEAQSRHESYQLLNARSGLRSSESLGATSFAVDPSEKEQLSPPKITPGHLRELDHRTSMHLLMYFTHWINVHLQNPGDPLTAISTGHAQWIFALLTKVEDQLSGDEMNLLRTLARACLGLLQRHRDRHDAVLGGDGNLTRMSDASCWMVFAAIAGYWGQRDLWADAVSALGSA